MIITFAATACSMSTSTGSAPAAPAPSSAPASRATTAPSPTAAPPKWAAALGPGVTVISPKTAKAGDGSPAGVFLTFVKVAQAGSLSRLCPLYQPAVQSKCRSAAHSIPESDAKNSLSMFKDATLGYTAVQGNEALVSIVVTMCTSGGTACTSNNGPSGGLDSGKPFGVLWKKAIADDHNANRSDSFELAPLIKVNGTWYADATGM